MSPPDANIEKQKRRHWPVFLGTAVAIALAVVLWLVIQGTMDEAGEDTTPTLMEDGTDG